jgi:excisionase family DNA binding protein
MNAETNAVETCLTVAEVAERLKVNEDTVRRLFSNEPGVIVFCFPRKGRRLYRTLRIPESVFRRVLLRFTKVA